MNRLNQPLRHLWYGIVFILIVEVLTPLSPVYAQIPFGGPITFINYATNCFEGQQIYVGPPGPVQSYMSSYGTIAYPHGPYSHIGQYVLGMAVAYMTCTFYCGVSVCVIPGGPLILYYGASH